MSTAISRDGCSCETALELESNRRMLHFSDGVMEDTSTSDSEIDADAPDSTSCTEIDERQLTLGPRLRYKASKMGNNILAGIDYVGGGLASFFGITTPKYSSELESYKRAKEQEASITVDGFYNNNRNESIVLCAPTTQNGPIRSSSISSPPNHATVS